MLWMSIALSWPVGRDQSSDDRLEASLPRWAARDRDSATRLGQPNWRRYRRLRSLTGSAFQLRIWEIGAFGADDLTAKSTPLFFVVTLVHSGTGVQMHRVGLLRASSRNRGNPFALLRLSPIVRPGSYFGSSMPCRRTDTTSSSSWTLRPATEPRAERTTTWGPIFVASAAASHGTFDARGVLRIEVTWENNALGSYQGWIDSRGGLVGSTRDLTIPGSREVHWQSKQNFTCAVEGDPKKVEDSRQAPQLIATASGPSAAHHCW